MISRSLIIECVAFVHRLLATGVKKPLSAYFMFAEEMRQGTLSGKKVTQAEIKEAWHKLGEKIQSDYKTNAKKNKADYDDKFAKMVDIIKDEE